MNSKKTIRILAVILAFCMLALTAVQAFAAEELGEGQRIVCRKQEHEHTYECYNAVLICGMEESEGHYHDASCYTETKELTCPYEQGSVQHVHTDDCYTVTLVNVCGKDQVPADPGHTHSDECRDADGNLVCGQTERPAVEGHTHTADCFTEKRELTCTKDTNPHIHSDECYTIHRELTCKKQETPGHKHNNSCYKLEDSPICGKEEHIHTHADGCISSFNDDVESMEIWEHMFDDVELSGVWGKDVVTIAETQVGYHHSGTNFMYNSEGVRCGYTRYGHWYALNELDHDMLYYHYEYWCADFVSFCLCFAGIPEECVPRDKACRPFLKKMEELDLYEQIRYIPQEEQYVPNPGDVIFFDFHNHGGIEHVGLVKEVDLKNKTITTIEGNVNACVKERVFKMNCGFILGYGNVGKAYERYLAQKAYEETVLLENNSIEILFVPAEKEEVNAVEAAVEKDGQVVQSKASTLATRLGRITE